MMLLTSSGCCSTCSRCPPAALRESASAAALSLPGAYLIAKSNSANCAAQRTWRGVAMADVSTYCSDWWSVTMVKCRPPR